MVYINYHKAAKRLESYTQTARLKDTGQVANGIPQSSIKPEDMAKYTGVTFNDLEEVYIFEQRYLSVRIISDPFLSSDGQHNFLAMDSGSDSNRVLRFNVVGCPKTWGLFCFEEG